MTSYTHTNHRDLHNVSPCVLANSIHPSPDSIHRRAHNFRLISLLIRRLMRPNQDTIHSDAEDTIEREGRVSRSDMQVTEDVIADSISV